MSARVGSDFCIGHMPRCQADVYTDEPASCPWAGLPDKVSGCLLCRSHQLLGLVNEAKALQLLEPVLPGSSSVQQLVASLFSGCLAGKLSLHNDLGVQHSSLLSDAARANVAAACKAELVRRHSEQLRGNGNLTKCHNLLNRLLPPSAPTMLAPPAGEGASGRSVGGQQLVCTLRMPVGRARRRSSRCAPDIDIFFDAVGPRVIRGRRAQATRTAAAGACDLAR